MRTPEGRSVQQLAEVLASLATCSTAREAEQAAVERIAECLEAEAGLLVHGDVVVASVGFRSDAPLPAGLVELAATDGGEIAIPGAGVCKAVGVPVPADVAFRLLVVRSGEGFSPEEVSLLRSLGRILATALDTLQLRDDVADSEAKFRRIVETASEGIWLLDPDGKTVFANDKIGQILGYSPTEMATLSLFDVVDDEGRPHAARNLQRRRDGMSDQLECAFVRQDGVYVWVLLHASPIRDSDGSFMGSLCMLSDISERKRIEDVLSQREQQLADAQRVAGLGSFEWDLVNLTGSWSDGLYRILGLDPDQAAPDMGTFLSAVHPQDREAMQRRARAALANEEVDEIEYRIIRPSGEVVWVRARSEVLRDPRDQPLLFRGTLLDVTASKTVEDALRDTTARLRLLEAMATAANEASCIEEILDVAAREICAHTGWIAGHAYVPVEGSSDQMTMLANWHLANPRWHEAVADLPTPDSRQRGVLWQVLSTRGAAWTRDLAGEAKTATEHALARLGCRGSFAFPVRVGADVTSVLEFFSPDGVEPDAPLLETINQVATQLSRVAERQRTNAELATARDAAMESSRLKSDFLATMSHEIRTPMNGVIGLTGLLLSTELDERQLQYAQGVESAGEALLAIINDILDLSKIEAGRLDLDDDDFDLVQVIEEALGLVSQSAHRKGLELVSHLDPGLPVIVRGDPARLRQVLLNLTSNATKFTSDGEVVLRVRMVAETDHGITLRFEVSDTGLGIPEGARSRLFEPFSQADASTTRRFGGTGLGLAISQRLVTAMGGEIGFESVVGAGSTFWFSLTLGRTTSLHVDHTSLPCQRILIIDRNASTRTALHERVVHWGMDCDVATDAAEALTALRTANAAGGAYDVVLLDSAMRAPGGGLLISEIDADLTLNNIRVVALTSATVHTRPNTSHPRFANTLTKPVRLGRFRDVLIERGLPALVGPWHASPRAPDSRGRVLVVEDNATNQLVAVGILRLLGYCSDVAANGYEALDALTRTDYVAVLMDCQMPEMDGYTATREIRAVEGALRHTPIIAMTAGVTDADRERCYAAGMDDFIAKPVKGEDIDAALNRWSVARAS